MIVNETKDTALIDNSQMGYSLDEEYFGHIMGMLSSNLYPNAIKAVIQEYISNAYDAMEAAGTLSTHVIKVTLKPDAKGDWQFIVADRGTGLSPANVNKYFMGFGASTARGKAGRHGAKGLGSKSAFAYAESYQLITVIDGVKYHYLFTKNGNKLGGGLMTQEATDEPNGSTVLIPVKSSDKYNFANTLVQTIPYFTNVQTDIDFYGAGYSSIPEQQAILTYTAKGKPLFKVTNQTVYDSMHFVLGQVHYPIDWGVLGMNRINTPVGIHIGLDEGVNVTPNRSEILYSQETVIILREKIKQVTTRIGKMYSRKSKDIYTDPVLWLKDFEEQRARTYSLYFNFTSDDTIHTLDIKPCLEYIDMSPTLPSLKGYWKDISLNKITLAKLGAGLKKTAMIHATGKQKIKPADSDGRKILQNLEDVNYMLHDAKLKMNTNAYISSQAAVQGTFYLVENSNLTDSKLCTLLNIREDLPTTPSVLADYRKFVSHVLGLFPKYSDVVVDDQWLDEYREAKRELRNVANPSTRLTMYEGTNMSRTYRTLGDLRKGGVQVYGTFNNSEETHAIKALYASFGATRGWSRHNNTPRTEFCLVSKTNFKLIQNEDTFVHVWDYLKDAPKVLRKLATYIQNEKAVNAYMNDLDLFPLTRSYRWSACDRFPFYKRSSWIMDKAKRLSVAYYPTGKLMGLVQPYIDSGNYDKQVESALAEMPTKKSVQQLEYIIEAISYRKNKLAARLFIKEMVDSALYLEFSKKDREYIRSIPKLFMKK